MIRLRQALRRDTWILNDGEKRVEFESEFGDVFFRDESGRPTGDPSPSGAPRRSFHFRAGAIDIEAFPDLSESVSKNLTVSLDEKSCRRAKIAAAERRQSGSALVREYFLTLGAPEKSPYRVESQEPRSLLEMLGDDRLAEVDFEIPRFEEPSKPADLA